MVTVPKPTQVGRKKILRRARELSLRNSANYSRNFGRRETFACDCLYGMSIQRSQRNGPGDCLPKTQHYAKPSKAQYMV
jgi:hypothetical protein